MGEPLDDGGFLVSLSVFRDDRVFDGQLSDRANPFALQIVDDVHWHYFIWDMIFIIETNLNDQKYRI